MPYTVPRTWVAGETVTAALMNTHVRDQFRELGLAWTSYTPTIGGWTRANGTSTGNFIEFGKFIIFRARYTVGSTDTISGGLTMTLPVAAADAVIGDPVGTAGLVDTSASSFRAWQILLNDVGGAAVRFRDATGNALNPTTPFTWATGDVVSMNGSYEAA